MQAIGFYLLLPLLYFISILPFPVLYLFSDIGYFFVYHLFDYRKKVVFQNLKNSFPEKTDLEIHDLSKQYFHHLCDLIVESLKALTISRKAINKRCRFVPGAMPVFDNFYRENRNVVVMMGHFGNWEWGGLSMSSQSPYLLQVLYRPLSNKYFDRLFIHLRNRFGARPLEMENAFRELVKGKKILSCTVFIADQTPPADAAFWIEFLNQQTPVFRGAARIAKKLNYPVLYASLKKVKRGYYDIYIEPLSERTDIDEEDEIIRRFNRRLEKDIYEQPFNWLWSHRRWKHKKSEVS
jgi:KDO2-lipid IV(A) lauroyltransferase